NKNYLMGLSHVAHDCKIGDEVVMCNNALLAGYVELGDKVFMGGGSAVHQFARVGTVAMVGGLTRVNQDVVPYTLIECDAEVRGLNTVGMKRANIKPEARSQIKQAYKILYLSGLSIPSALERIQAMPDPANEITVICEFIRRSKRGICMHKKKS
ncbi:MAG: acyl-ACP--UDP-N-acetylglucosamine O-acyltransferase, partial [Candidatus Omnitrophota bacterium]